MELDSLTKLIFGAVSAIGTIAVTFYNFRQTKTITAELLEKLESAIENSQKHSTTELFRLIHGLRMNYSDIIELTKHDECAKIIYSLKKTPGIVSYKNGTYEYNGLGKNKLFRQVDRWTNKIGILIFGFFTVLLIVIFVLSKGTSAITAFVLMLFCAIMFALQLRQKNYDQMVQNLISPENDETHVCEQE